MGKLLILEAQTPNTVLWVRDTWNFTSKMKKTPVGDELEQIYSILTISGVSGAL